MRTNIQSVAALGRARAAKMQRTPCGRKKCRGRKVAGKGDKKC